MNVCSDCLGRYRLSPLLPRSLCSIFVSLFEMATLTRTWSLSQVTSAVIRRNVRTFCKRLNRPAFAHITKKDTLSAVVLRPVATLFWNKSGCVFIAVRSYGSHYENYNDLKYEDFAALLEGGDIQLIDVRDEKDILDQGEFPNAIHIPLCDLKAALVMEEKDFTVKYGIKKPTAEDTNLVFVSFKSVKSSAALEIAHKNGYKNARQYSNGFEEWKVKQEEERRVGTS